MSRSRRGRKKGAASSLRQVASTSLVGLLWLLHWLPLPALRALGAVLGRLLFAIGRERRRVALLNLRLCFPELEEAARRDLARRHFIAFARAFLDRTLLWWAPRSRLESIIRLEGREHLTAADGQPTILLAPHFVGLDAAGSMMTMQTPLVSVYANQKNPVFNDVLLAGRLRFNDPVLLSRQDGMRRALKCLREGLPFYYLPDMDYGARDAVFVPFFGVPAATITGVSRLARIAGARVVPCVARMTAAGYTIELQAPWESFPGDDIEADTRRMNEYIESQVRRMPEQYFWLHKRFKTRPPGEPRFY
ncbi:lipid A biosynthesis acyltransferase [Rhodocyclus tenuis]|uniref:LpxL/LpxP family acyltransferase n=1 Tax=Rhodocyclus tenuis TaxID=1066 RepID=UPI00190545B5|nr:lipid A biosynthesis acyltransferase [Rhodocyclus tenuis]MBK1680328.1 lipid A biosynthesis acyltransferase [Rhodocyclus tenuis]